MVSDRNYIDWNDRLTVLQCMSCNRVYSVDTHIYKCESCDSLLDVRHDLDAVKKNVSRQLFDDRLGLGPIDTPYHSGVWRYKELIYPAVDVAHIVTHSEGNTGLYHVPKLAKWVGVDTLYLKHEGENPTGSFKDRGMTSGVTQAKVLGMKQIICASTGNTSAALAAFAPLAGMQGIVMFQKKGIALGKLAQAIAYGAIGISVDTDFDRNLILVRELASKMGMYVLNSINPFRLEGQKSIIFELIQQLRWEIPDWIFVAGGNLGNGGAFGKAVCELRDVGLTDRIPHIGIVQAEGANPLYQSYKRDFSDFTPVKAHTIATAIKIGNPVNYPKAVRVIRDTNGVVEQASDQEIMDAKAQIDSAGIGCEPAAASSLAGVKKLVVSGVIQRGESVVCVLTGHLLKDPDAVIGYHMNQLEYVNSTHANSLYNCEDDIHEIMDVIEKACLE